MSNILITGAGGFVGHALAARLCGLQAAGQPAFDSLTLLDQRLPPGPAAVGSVRRIEGDMQDRDVLADALATPPDLVYHLAGVTSRQAEADVALSLRVNVGASIALLELLRIQAQQATVVFASSIGVFGTPLPPVIDDDTPQVPALSYGAQKKMVEVLLADYSRRAFVRGLSVRLPSVVARPAQPGGALSAFASDLIRELAQGRPFTCPVPPDAAIWFLSVSACIDNLLHAAVVASAGQDLPATRALNLPALRATPADIVDTLARCYGDGVRRRITYRPDAALQAQFATWPPLFTPAADRLGFRHDGDLASLLTRSLQSS